jgi:60 kDa SS-A/Ro ribonucleoprotein
MQRNKVSELYGSRNPYSETKKRNYEGAPTFASTPEEQLLCVLMTGTMEDIFYVSQKELAEDAITLFKYFAVADPEFLAKAIVYARNDGFMRFSPISALVVLSTATNKEYFKQAFPRTIRTPGDLQDFVAIVRTGKIRGMGRVIKEAVNDWLANLSEYHIIKYGSGNQAMSLRDIYRMTRPKPMDNLQLAKAKYIVNGELAGEGLEQLATYERFKKEGRDEKNAITLIREGRLPYEVVTAIAPSTEAVWAELLRQAPYMNLIRNLNNFDKYDVFKDSEAVEYAVNVIADENRVKNSMQFPFRFFAAAQEFGGKNQKITEALHEALEISLGNIPDLGNSTLASNDISGSMSQNISPRSKVTAANIAGIFAAAVFKKAKDGRIISFEAKAHRRNVSTRDSMLSIAKAVGTASYGATAASAPILQLCDRKEFVDTIIMMTDSESWADRWVGDSPGTVGALRKYKAEINPEVKTFLIQLMPYGHRLVEESEPNCNYIYGWSPDVVRYIGYQVESQTQLEKVKAIEL